MLIDFSEDPFRELIMDILQLKESLENHTEEVLEFHR